MTGVTQPPKPEESDERNLGHGHNCSEPVRQIKVLKDEGSTTDKQKYSDKHLGEPLAKKKGGGKCREQMAHTVLAAPRMNTAPLALLGKDSGMADTGQNNARFRRASMGQQALSKKQTITFVPATLQHLAPQKAEKTGLGRAPGVSSPGGFSRFGSGGPLRVFQ